MKESEIIENVRKALDKYESRLSEINQKVKYKHKTLAILHNDILIFLSIDLV